MRSSRRIQTTAGALLCALALIAHVGGVAHAGGDAKASDAERAHTLYDLSAVAYEAGHFQEAIDLLLHAYELKPKPVLLFNLARAYEGLGDQVKAIDAYEAYLKAEPTASDHGSIEQRLATLRKDVAARTALEEQRDEARRHAEEERQRAIEERRKAAAEALHAKSAFPWVLASVGGAGVVAGVVLGVISRSRYQAAVDEPYRAPAADAYASAKTYALAANVGLIAGGAVAAIGLTWGLVEWRRASPPPASAGIARRLEVVVSPVGVALVGRY
jgi:tetratricopeptide (TPR) repeat protein